MMLLNAIHIGDALATLKKFPSESVHCIVTSPPYLGLRDYGVAGQLGLEQSPDEYLDKLVAIFREARRVLRHDGTCWVNMGDSYSDKQLMLIPFRLALALQADGYWVRQTNIWHKPSCMPQSVTDRTTTDFEYVFHLAKSAHYWYDADAIRESGQTCTRKAGGYHDDIGTRPKDGNYRNKGGIADKDTTTIGRNKRAVWTIPSTSFPGSHFATFPQALPELCIAAGCPETCCAKCGAGYVRVTELSPDYATFKAEETARRGRMRHDSGDMFGLSNGKSNRSVFRESITLGFKPSCTCGTDETKPGVVLDMFGGAGTTALAAKHLGRDYVLIELNPRYVEMAQKRIKNYDPLQPTEFKDGSRQLSLFGEAV